MMQHKKLAESSANTDDIEIHVGSPPSNQADTNPSTSTATEDKSKKPSSSSRCEEQELPAARNLPDDDGDNHKDGHLNDHGRSTASSHLSNSSTANTNNGPTTSNGVSNGSSHAPGGATDELAVTVKAKGPSPPTSSSSTSSQHSTKSESLNHGSNVIAENINAKFTKRYPALGIKASSSEDNNANQLDTNAKKESTTTSRLAEPIQPAKRTISRPLRTSPTTKSTITKPAGATRVPLASRTRNGAGKRIDTHY
ncbi:hypothetical protein BDF19DRAFT_120193 [Syncephalis fuscata]|nr:hypothetical protein BDF19DRAFT_120193 [Syncephalis fuscata]